VTNDYHGARLTIRQDGRRLLTPMFIVVVAIGGADLVFAVDSIPAIFGITQDAYVVFAANAFALMGLRRGEPAEDPPRPPGDDTGPMTPDRRAPPAADSAGAEPSAARPPSIPTPASRVPPG
jgi:hypothetical protein